MSCTHSFGVNPPSVTVVCWPGKRADVLVRGVEGRGSDVTTDSVGTVFGAPAGNVVEVVDVEDVVVDSATVELVVVEAAAAARVAASAANCET